MAVRPSLRVSIHSARVNIPTNPASLKSRRYSSDTRALCPCKLSMETIKKNLREGNKTAIKLEMGNCEAANKHKIDWEAYKVDSIKKPETNHCKVLEVFTTALPLELFDQKNIKQLDPIAFLAESQLSVLSSEPGKVTLSGEGGKHVGRKEYWDSILSHFQKHKHLSVCVLSIGGAIGYDAIAITQVLKTEGFKVQKPIVIDPNGLAAYFSEEDKVDYYVTTSQRFFDDYFVREKGMFYVIHLGTTLNVVKENDVLQILQQITEKMTSSDVLSLIMVDKKQFSQGKHLTFGEENEQGISRVINLKTGKHYKTVITNSKKFLNYMTTLGLQGDIIDVVE